MNRASLRPARAVKYAAACAAAIVCLALAGLWLARPVFAQPGRTISVESFWRQVDQTQAWLEGNPADDSPSWQAEAERWRATREVKLPGGQVVPVDTGYLVSLLSQDEPDRAVLAAYLQALKQARALTTPPGGERELLLLNEILARPEFQKAEVKLNFLQKIAQWLLDQFYRLLDLLFGSLDSDNAIPPQITIVVTLVLLAAILAYIFRDTLRNLFAEAELAEEGAGEGEVLSARLAGQRAQALSNSGDYRHALRYLYLSALLLLDERGLLRYNRAQTNREYLRQVRGRPDLAEHLKVVVDTFDRVWYGFQPIDEASYARYAEHVSALEETRE